MWGIVCLVGLGLTHGLRWSIKRLGWLALPPAAFTIRIMAATLLIATASYLLTLALSQAVYDAPVAPIAAAFYQKLTLGGQLRNLFIIILAVHAAWVAIYLAFAMQRRRYLAELRQAQLGEALQAAELRLLKSQLNPHFLFNALNGLRSLIADEPGRARDAVTQLSRTLRYTLASGEEDLVSLERELEMVDDYLALESLRLAERLRVERDIAPAARTARIPAMLLQTLVENAIKHGIAPLKEGGTLRIQARVVGNDLVVQVTIRGRDEHGDDRTKALGLRNSSERLRLLFGARAQPAPRSLATRRRHRGSQAAGMKALVVDDEPLARRELRRLLAAFPACRSSARRATSTRRATRIEALAPDVVFLDIQMPGGTGFDLLTQLDRVPRIVFTTAYDQYAVKAFDVNALDYLLKPIEPERLAMALQKIQATARQPAGRDAPLEQLFVRDGPRCWFVPLREVSLFCAEGNYVRMSWGKERPLLGRSLAALEEKLDPKRFFRANRSQILNLDFIQHVELGEGGRLHVQLRDGPEIEVSRRQARLFRARTTVT